MKKCSNCGKEYSEGVYCPFCATPYDPIVDDIPDDGRPCPLCGSQMSYRFRFCNLCGSELPPKPPEVSDDKDASPDSGHSDGFLVTDEQSRDSEHSDALDDSTTPLADESQNDDAAIEEETHIVTDSDPLNIPKPDYEPIAVRKPYPLQKPADDLSIDVYKHVRVRRVMFSAQLLAIASILITLGTFSNLTLALLVVLCAALIIAAAYTLFSVIKPNNFPISSIFRKSYCRSDIVFDAVSIAVVIGYAALALTVIPDDFPLNKTFILVCSAIAFVALTVSLASAFVARRQAVALTIAIYGHKNPTSVPRITSEEIFAEYIIFESETDRYQDYLRELEDYRYEHPKSGKTREAKGFAYSIYKHRKRILITFAVIAVIAAVVTVIMLLGGID